MMSLLQHPIVPALGWALLHFLWQGCLLGAFAFLAIQAVRGARLRYLILCAALLACLLLPLGYVLRTLAATPSMGQSMAAFHTMAAALPPAPGSAPMHLPWPLRLQALLQQTLPFVVLAWSLGVAVLGLRLTGGWLCLRHLGARRSGAAPEALVRRVECLSKTFQLSRNVIVKVSCAIHSPMVLGWWRPVILVPAALLANMSPELLEALLAHELAHVKRWDFLVNLLQSVVEVLLFFHPVVWWISRRIRLEREHACDDLAGAACGDPRRLACALNALDELQPRLQTLALAAHGGNLMLRIRRLVRPEPRHSAWLGALLTLGLSTAALAGAVLQATYHPEHIFAPPERVQEIDALAKKEGIDPYLLRAMAQAESRFNPSATSPLGAMGILQVMPETAKKYGATDLKDPAQVAAAGARYLRFLLDRYHGDLNKAVAAYNCGEEAFDAGKISEEAIRYRAEVLAMAKAKAVEPEPPLAEGEVRGEFYPSGDGRTWFMETHLSSRGGFSLEVLPAGDASAKPYARCIMGSTGTEVAGSGQESRPKIRLELPKDAPFIVRCSTQGLKGEVLLPAGQEAYRFTFRMEPGK